jgi:hypothetical protein
VHFLILVQLQGSCNSNPDVLKFMDHALAVVQHLYHHALDEPQEVRLLFEDAIAFCFPRFSTFSRWILRWVLRVWSGA